ncbi:MAG: segregation and condensation protein A [Mycoplasmoidaceae bacterium]
MSDFKNLSNFDNLSLTIGDFNGPVDLLFSLIKERKFDILNIDLLYVSVSYVNYVQKHLHDMKIDDITEYLSMITYFFELKSKKILGITTSQEKLENEMEDDKFIQRILLQKQFRELVPNLFNRMAEREKMHTKEVDFFQLDDIVQEEMPESISPNVLLKSMRNIFKKLQKNENDIINIDISELSIEDVTNEITNFLKKLNSNNISLFELLSSFPSSKISKQYLAVTFVALLVLVRNGNIVLEQEINNDVDIIIKKIDLGL